MTYRKTMVLLLGTVAAASLAGATPKEEAVAGLRESFSRRTPYIAGNLRSKTPEFLKLLDDNGSFRDLSELTVKSLDGIRGIDQTADRFRILEIR